MTSSSPTAAGPPVRARRRRSTERPPLVLAIAFLLPALVLYVGLLVYPMFQALSYSFFSWQGIARDSFTGLANYIALFADDLFSSTLGRAFGHNVILFVVALLVQNTLGMWLAWQVSKTRARKVLRVLYTAPYLVSALVVGFLWKLMLGSSGAINGILGKLGLGDLAQPWLGDPALALPTVIFVIVWQWIGFPILLYGAAISGLPGEILDAASVDGASGLRRFWSITLPLMMPAVGTVTILTFIAMMETLAVPFALGGPTGSPAGSTDVLSLVFYRTAFQPGDLNALGRSSALAVLMFCLIFGVSAIGNKLLRNREVAP